MDVFFAGEAARSNPNLRENGRFAFATYRSAPTTEGSASVNTRQNAKGLRKVQESINPTKITIRLRSHGEMNGMVRGNSRSFPTQFGFALDAPAAKTSPAKSFDRVL